MRYNPGTAQKGDSAAPGQVGADDYLPKPFGPRELLARVRAVPSRGHMPSATTGSISFGPFRLDKLSHTLTRDEVEVAPT